MLRMSYSDHFLSVSVCTSGQMPSTFSVNVSVEFHIMWLTSVYSVIVGLILYFGVKKLVLWG